MPVCGKTLSGGTMNQGVQVPRFFPILLFDFLLSNGPCESKYLLCYPIRSKARSADGTPARCKHILNSVRPSPRPPPARKLPS